MIQLFKKGSTHTVKGIKCDMQTVNEYSYLHLLDDGWCYTPEETVEEVVEETTEEKVEPAEKEIETLTAEEIQRKINESFPEDPITELEIVPDEDDEKDKEDAIRQAAKAAGIKGWYNTKIEKLIEKMKELENGGSEG